MLAGTDVTGSIPREVALLSQMGLEPTDALTCGACRWTQPGRGDDLLKAHPPGDARRPGLTGT